MDFLETGVPFHPNTFRYSLNDYFVPGTVLLALRDPLANF